MSNLINKVKDKMRVLCQRVFIYLFARHENFNPKWFQNKSVAIVGGADSIIQHNNGNLIDSYDVVVRVNKGVEILATQSEFAGTRTDFLFHSFYIRDNDVGSSPITLELWKQYKVQHIIFAHNYFHSRYALRNIRDFFRVAGRQLSFSQLPKKIFQNNLSITAPFGPTTGMIAISTILQCNPKKIYVTGITFLKTPHNQHYRQCELNNMKEMPGHDTNKEFQYFKRIYKKKRHIIEVDNVLRQLCNEV